jgi:hypothetical protein
VYTDFFWGTSDHLQLIIRFVDSLWKGTFLQARGKIDV